MYGLKNRVVRMDGADVQRMADWMNDGNVEMLERGYRVQGGGHFRTWQDLCNWFMRETADCELDLKFEDRRDYYGE